MKEHPTNNVTIKQAPVDLGIQPVVDWLNSFKGIYTRWCCQGNYHKNGSAIGRDGAYVIFYCEDPVDLLRVCKRVANLADLTVHEYQGMLRYHLYFGQKAPLDSLISRLRP